MSVQDFTTTTEDGLTLHGKVYAADSLPASAPAIICLHGLTRNERDFSDVAPWLSNASFGGQQFRVFCLSFRGRGRSDYDPNYLNYHPGTYANDVLGLMRDKAIPQAVFIGTSLGGLTTMLTAGLEPTAVRAAILNDIAPELAPEGIARIVGYVGQSGPAADWSEAAAKIKAINEVAFPDADDAFWTTFAKNTFREEDGKVVLDYDPKISEALAEVGPAPDLWPTLEGMTCPILSIRGEISDLFTEEIQQKMVARQPRVEPAIVPRVGHAPMLTEIAAKDAIQKFLSAI